MSKVKIQGNASGTGVLTVTAPNTSTDRTITLPDSTGTLATTADTFNPDAAVTINESGADVDFRVESDDDANAFFIEGSDGKVGIGTATPNSGLHVSSGDTWATRVQQTDAALHGFITQVPSPDASKYGITLYDTTAGDFTFRVMQNGAITAGSITTTSMPQKGGVDVAAHGSNSNGNYFKFADGTMICTVSKSVSQQNNGATAGGFYYSNTGTWTYPVAFTGSVRVIGNTQGGHYNAISVKTPSVGTSSCTYMTLSLNSTGNAQDLYLFAIGVWN